MRILTTRADERANWKVAGGGYGIHWPDVDEDVSTEGLLRGSPVLHVWSPHLADPAQAADFSMQVTKDC